MKHLSLNVVQLSNRFAFGKLEVALKSKLFNFKTRKIGPARQSDWPRSTTRRYRQDQTQPLGVGPPSTTQPASHSNACGLMFTAGKLCARIYSTHVIGHVISHLCLTLPKWGVLADGQESWFSVPDMQSTDCVTTGKLLPSLDFMFLECKTEASVKPSPSPVSIAKCKTPRGQCHMQNSGRKAGLGLKLLASFALNKAGS